MSSIRARTPATPGDDRPFRFDLRMMFLISSVCAVQAALLGYFLQDASLADKGMLLAGCAAGLALHAVLHSLGRRWRPAHSEAPVRIPLPNAPSMPQRIARLFFYGAAIASFAGMMAHGEDHVSRAFWAGLLLMQMTMSTADQLLFDRDYGRANFYPTHLSLSLGEHRNWKELTVRWGAADGEGQCLALLLPTPRTIREINLHVPREKVEAVQEVLARAACAEELALDG
ncbi:hypothetical protein Pla123a_07960 [Posidoniimonas polymericola]|uniref:Uncharacterized protein n=1 Tax=Posidoniimonas polymericola TaxID=2528002 RepID=A0A5C5ZFL6_9BACT|nr:hypothetical protein [Posidoniimonas polymericola]TWT85988.1 hypothetical protein Pla123a_07960 [Posidoniimonas polymericola]